MERHTAPDTGVAVAGDERATIEAARAGDPDAFAPLVERYREVAFRTAYLIARDAGIAEDVAQEAFVRAYLNLRQFRAGDPFRPWLLRIVTNLALNEVRARGRRRGLLERATRRGLETARAPDPEQAALAGEQSRLLLLAMGELRGEDQVVLYLRHFLDLPEREIADVIGKRPGTVKSRLHRAGERLRAVIEQRYPELAPGGMEEQRRG